MMVSKASSRITKCKNIPTFFHSNKKDKNTSISPHFFHPPIKLLLSSFFRPSFGKQPKCLCLSPLPSPKQRKSFFPLPTSPAFPYGTITASPSPPLLSLPPDSTSDRLFFSALHLPRVITFFPPFGLGWGGQPSGRKRRRRRRKRKRMAREMKRGGDNRKKKMRKEVHTYMGWQAGMFYKQTKSLPGVWYSKELLRTKRVFKSWN